MPRIAAGCRWSRMSATWGKCMSICRSGIRRPRCSNISHGSRIASKNQSRSRMAATAALRRRVQGRLSPNGPSPRIPNPFRRPRTHRGRSCMARPAVEREFEGKTAFVLGGSSGIGLASAELFAERGANVVVVGHADDTYEAARKIAGEGRRAIGLAGDASKADFVHKAIERTMEEFGSLDILMCSAAIHPLGDVLETDEATWDRAFEVNVKSMYLCCHYGVPHMVRGGGGSIVTLSSVQATSNTPNVCAY